MTPSAADPLELLEIARSIALEAGAMIVEARRGGVEVADRKSSPVDVVTQVDRDSEQLIRTRLAEARSDDGFFGEEGARDPSASGVTWVVDPIDGTVNFLYGIPHYAVSIAAVEGEADPQTWRALAAVVLNPVTGELFSATEGGGARLGDAPISIRPAAPLSQSLIATGFAYAEATRAEQGAAIARLLPRVRDVRRMGTASLDLCAVACGRVDAYFERTLSPWDHAAGALIAHEAGAVVTGLDGRRPDHLMTLAAHPDSVVALEAVLREIGA
ncbi:inositol monophosphatase family protein [Microcella daejeonensis]|uniref:inositol monophosphatase family protein n=1 Tax=Microcella daejeonensis TaxID=2994971 RepID=UPI00226FB384|nr:inositol monophosphatase family protein [Microcella daejeonensis]WAB84222.1 inositol monophosphatase family protein [Microcella daejeonensis]